LHFLQALFFFLARLTRTLVFDYNYRTRSGSSGNYG